MRRAEAAFTLVEVMVALAVVAVAITALLSALATHIDGSAHLRDKLLAQWVALNQIELARLENRHSNQLPNRAASGTAEMGGQRWQWRGELIETQGEGAAQWRVSVSATPDGVPSAEFSAILDTWHRQQ